MPFVTQIQPKVFTSIGFGNLTYFGGPLSGEGSVVTSAGAIPMPLGGTVKKLSVYAIEDRPTRVTVTLQHNLISTPLSITLDAGVAGVTSWVSDDVEFSPGDLLNYKFVTNDLVVNPGFALAVTIEIESTGLMYGLTAFGGTVIVGEGFAGGALGNGFFSNSGGGGDMGVSYSLCNIECSVDQLMLHRITGQSGGAWTGYLLKNGVLQDGSGGTVDTTTLLDDSGAATVTSSFLLSLSAHDQCSVYVVRSGSTASFGTQVAAGVSVTPTVDGDFMFAGGSNDTISNSGTTWKWTQSRQNAPTEIEHTAYAGLTAFTLTSLYVERLLAPGDGSSVVYALLRNGEPTGISATIADLATSADGSGSFTYQSGDKLTLRVTNVGSPIGATELHWGVGGTTIVLEPEPVPGVIGELAWWHRRKRLTNGTTITTVHSDQDMQCPAEWYGGYKEGVVEEFFDSERAASNPVTGDPQGATFRLRQSDTSRALLAEFASAPYRYWVGNNPVYMTTRRNRAELGVAYCVFNGPIIDAQPNGLAWDITLGDAISRQLLSDDALIPWRQFKNSNLSEFIEISETLDREAPEPIIYGQHFRVPDVDPASPQGFIYTPTLMGKFEVAGDAWWCWEVCGHAVADLVDVYVIEQTAEGPESPGSITADEGTKWLIPHYSGHTAQFGAPYEDVRSDTFGNLQRVTRIYGKVGEDDPDACAVGTKILAVAVEGVEPFGDGSGEVVTDRIQQYQHFAINYIAHSGAESYQTGLWLENPVWDLPEGPLKIIDENAFTRASAIAAERLPAVGSPSLYPAGYIGAGIIGAHGGDQQKVSTWVAEFNKSCGVRQGFDHFGRFTIGMLHPTQDVKDAAPLITDEFTVIKDTFETPIQWTQHANRQPFEADYEHVTGRWMTSDVVDADASIANYNQPILGELRRYRFAPGISMASHLARLAVLENQHPPRGIVFEGTIGPDPNGDSLGYLDLFDYVRYRHFASISEDPRDIRLAWILKHQVQAGKRRVRIEAIDVEELIGDGATFGGADSYDLPPATETPGGDPIPERDNRTRAEAIIINPFAHAYELTINTTDYGTDDEPPSFCGSGIAYHAAWWTITPADDGEYSFSTLGSSYDTTISVWTAAGSPEMLTLEGCNDNVAPLNTSVLTLDLIGGVQYFILVSGYGPSDAGTLKFSMVTPEVGDLYVATSGSDSPGVSGAIDAPFRTIGHALSVLGGPGTVLVRGGTYDETLVNNVPSGTSWSDKVRIAAFPGETVWLAPSVDTDFMIIWLSDAQSYIEFDGINLRAPTSHHGSVVFFGPNVHHCRVQNAELANGSGLGPAGAVSTGEHGTTNDAYHEFINLTVHGTGGPYGFYLHDNFNLVDGCNIYGVGGNGVVVFNNAGGEHGNVIRNCVIHDITSLNYEVGGFQSLNDPRRAAIQMHGGVNYAYNNVVYGIITNGSASDGCCISCFGAMTTDLKIWNCTFHGNNVDVFHNDTANTEITNNISYNNSGSDVVGSGTGATISNNSWQAPVSGADPLFVNSAARDYRLQSGSPCIDAGTTVATVTTDKDGVPRPQGGAYDQGAYEFHS